MTTYETFDDAYVSVLADIYHHPEYFNEPRGFSSREKLAVNFKINQPTQRVVYSRKRKQILYLILLRLCGISPEIIVLTTSVIIISECLITQWTVKP